MKNLIFDLCRMEGISGNEHKVAKLAMGKLIEYKCTAEILRNGSLIAKLGNEKSPKRILLDAHIDQIGLIVTDIDERGFLKVAPCGGNDRRIMPGSVVRVYGKKEIIGVVSCTPPHLKKTNDTIIKIEEMFIDVGISKEEACKNISLGDAVIFNSEPKELLGTRIASKALDNRASVAALIRFAELISKKEDILNNCFITILLSSQEETSSFGAITSAFDDVYSESIVVDVSFGIQPEITNEKAGEISKGPMIGISPSLSKNITNKLFEVAKANNIPFQTEVMAGKTGTNADKISITKSGISTGLVSIPQRNMHTAVEVVDIEDIENTAKLLDLYIESRVFDND